MLKKLGLPKKTRGGGRGVQPPQHTDSLYPKKTVQALLRLICSNMAFPTTISKAWYSLSNLLKRYSLTFINRTRHNKVVETGVMGGGYKKIDLPKNSIGRVC